MNKIIYQYNSTTQLTFADEGNFDGVLLEGSFYNETSLLEDELSIDTMKIRVRSINTSYPLHNFIYGSQVTFYKNDALYGKYYLVSVERQTKNEYILNVQSSIGLLDDTMHYGGIYSGEYASSIIEDIIGGKIAYTEHNIFSKIKVYGWLPVATRRENLKQLLFAVGGCVKKKNGDVYFTTLTVDAPKVIPENKVFDTGKITYDSPASRIEVVEHQFSKVDSVPSEEVYSGEIVGSSFVTPKGYSVSDAALVTWDKPYHSLTFSDCTLLNNEMGVNYAVVSASGSATISGKPYIHSKMIVSRDKENYEGKEKVAKVENATLVTLANSNSVADKVMAYYDSPCTLSGAIVMDGEKPLDNITMPNQFEEENTGMIKSIEGTLGKQITKGELELRIGYNPPPIYGTRTPVSLAVTTPPTKTVYEAGDSFDKTGMVVTVTYDDASTREVTNYNCSPVVLSINDTYITISYREMMTTVTTTQPVTVKNLLKKIQIITPPTETAYEIGDTIDLTGMVVHAFYSDGTSHAISDYTYSPHVVSSASDTEVTITYTEDGITKTAIQDITVGNTPNLVSIAVSTPPTKVIYKAGEYFDPSGMVVTATFDNGTTKTVSGYTYSPTRTLQQDDSVITISYTKKGVTKTTTQNITVVYLTSIAITNPPTYTSYYDDEIFNTAGMEVTAYYSDSTSAVITTYSVSPSGALPYGTTSVTISYTEGGITKTTTQDVTVSIRTYDYTNSTVITSGGTYNLSGLGATHRNIRVICIGGGTGGNGGKNGTGGASRGTCTSNNNNVGWQTVGGGSGGAGGAGGNGGSGGKITVKDYIITSLSDAFTIEVGTGGAGGTAGPNPTTGKTGTATSFTYNGTSTSSSTGTASNTGYTDKFTNLTYAYAGTNGTAGGAGGNSGSVNMWSTGAGHVNYDFTESENGTAVGSYAGGTAGAHDNDILSYSASPFLAMGCAGVGGGGGGAAYGKQGSNGDDASCSSSGRDKLGKYGGGGNGANAAAPATPSMYGCGGNGGHGGGGGGAAGQGLTVYSSKQPSSSGYYSNYAKYFEASGGSAGKGSNGTAGIGGCVIIYYS